MQRDSTSENKRRKEGFGDTMWRRDGAVHIVKPQVQRAGAESPAFVFIYAMAPVGAMTEISEVAGHGGRRKLR